MSLQSSGKKNTPFRVLAIEMNKSSKKKADLQEFTRTRLQLHVTGNETIAQLQKACLRKIYEITPPTPHDPTGFGVQCPVLRGAVHDGARLCEMGAADSLRGPCRLPAVAPGEVAGEPPSRTNQGGQEGHECEGSRSSEASSSSGICRIRQQLEVERGPDPDDPVSPRGGCSSPGGTPLQEGREARRTDDRGLLQGPLSLSTPEPESQALSDRICQFQCTIDVSQGATWEPLPEHKARQLAFQSDDMLPEAFGSLVSEGRLVVPHLWPLLCDATNQPAYPKAV